MSSIAINNPGEHSEMEPRNAIEAGELPLLQQWLAGELWASRADATLKKKWSELDTVAAWQRWTQYLESRAGEAIPAELERSEIAAVIWAVDRSPLGDELVAWQRTVSRLVSKGQRLTSQQAAKELLTPLSKAIEERRLESSLHVLVVAWQIDGLATVLDADAWWTAITWLTDLIEQVAAEEVDHEVETERMVVACLLAGELPLVLSCLLPEIKPLRNLRDEARAALGEGILSLTDGEGLIAAEYLPRLPLIAASWTRCRALGEQLKKGCWSASAETQYEWLIRQAIRLTTPTGQVMHSGIAKHGWTNGVLTAAIALAGDDGDRAAANVRLKESGVKVKGRTRVGDLPDPSVNSEWAGAAVLSNGWAKTANTIAVTYRGNAMQIEVIAGGRPLIGGEWLSHSSAGGQSFPMVGHWEEQCWYSDDEIDYLDVAIDLAHGGRLERHVVLLKEDNALLLHEVFRTKGDEPTELTHEAHLPVAAKIDFIAEPETREGLLVTGKRSVASVLPLAIPEWRADTRRGELGITGHHLELSQQQQGTRMCAPLWFDLDAKRAKRQRTWRQLTVAQKLERQPPDVAVGYRVQSGDEQWLIYKSLDQPANRTVMGQNLASEAFIARFLPGGDVHELIEIETPDD